MYPIDLASLPFSFPLHLLAMMHSLLLSALGLAVLWAPPLAAQTVGGGAHGSFVPTDQITDAQRADIQAHIDANVARLIADGVLTAEPAARVMPPLGFPLRSVTADADGYYAVSNFLDRQAGSGLQDYACGQRTYEGHRGLDLFTWPFPWEKMDNAEVEIVAAAAGTIVYRQDGMADRSCSFNGLDWNAVYIRHADGSVAWYGHMKTGSVTPKGVGDAVAQGERLGVVGSSGNSTGPHLHLELYSAGGALVDPSEGACNAQPSSWANQEPYTVSSILSVQTHDAAPVNANCPSTADQPNRASSFVRGDRVFVGSYLRDQFQGQTMAHSLRNPGGTVVASWTGALSAPFFPGTWWYYTYDLAANAPVGTWTYRLEFEGQTAETTFEVIGSVAGEDAPGTVEILSPRPNPTAGAASLTVRLVSAQTVRAEAFDARGRRVATLHDGPLAVGEHALAFDAAALPPGVYVVRVAAGDYRGAFPVTVAR